MEVNWINKLPSELMLLPVCCLLRLELTEKRDINSSLLFSGVSSRLNCGVKWLIWIPFACFLVHITYLRVGVNDYYHLQTMTD